MRILSIFLGAMLCASVLLGSPSQAEASTSQFYLRRNSQDRSRPVHRSVERATRNYRAKNAGHRRAFMAQLLRLGRQRDEVSPEYYRALAPAFNVDQQGEVPYYWSRTRRAVRHLYWGNYFREEPEAQQGEGPAGQ